VSIKKIYKYII